MATQAQIAVILQQMREMTEADLSVLQASVDTPDSSMTTAPGSRNEALWSAMEKLGWMVRTTDELNPPGVGRFLLQVYSLTSEGRVRVSHLLSIVREGEMSMADIQENANPPVKGRTVPYLTVDGAAKAVEFYKKAFAAEVASIQPPDEKGRIMHAHVYINGGSVMLSDAYPEHGHPLQQPAGFNILLPVDNIDAWYKRAVDAGCTPTMPPADMFWGDRYGQLKDPFGITWAMNAPIKK